MPSFAILSDAALTLKLLQRIFFKKIPGNLVDNKITVTLSHYRQQYIPLKQDSLSCLLIMQNQISIFLDLPDQIFKIMYLTEGLLTRAVW